MQQRLTIPMRLYRITRPTTRLELRRALESEGMAIQAGPQGKFLSGGIIMAWRQDEYFVWVREAYANHVSSDRLERKYRVAPYCC